MSETRVSSALGGRWCSRPQRADIGAPLWRHYGWQTDLHFLPSYSPDCNPIERVWWNLHEQITRNHQCKSMEELLDLTFTWLRGRNPFKVEGRSVYKVAA